MTAYRRPQAHKPRLPLWPFQLAILIASALVTAVLIWVALSLLFSMGTYIRSAL
jgi:hypothetical protein